MIKYLKRVVDEELLLKLESVGATLIVGPKWCGKTTTAMQKAKSCISLQDPDMRDAYIATAQVKPSNLLTGDNPRLIDEWQDVPELWDAVRTSVDKRQETGLYILTGSTSVDMSNIHHSGTGRISRLQMYPMSLYESGESNGKISLHELFDDPGLDIDGIQSNLDVNELIFAACRGGWPSTLSMSSDKYKLYTAKDYVENICNTDVSTIDGKTRSPSKTRLILQSYARNLSTLVSSDAMIQDVSANENISDKLFADYMNALKRLFVIEEVDAWCPNIRSKTAIRSSNKREFVDPSIAVAVLGLSPDYLQTDLNTFGFIFECLTVRDLRVYSAASGGSISYYRDRYGLEADIVLHLSDGRYALIEDKLGSREIEEASVHLNTLKGLIHKHKEENPSVKLREPDLLIVLTGGPIAYRRKDGVLVIPVGCLKD